MELFYSTDIRCGKGNRAGAERLVLAGGEADHCVRVMRHKEGESIFVIDGKGGLYNCRIEKVMLPKKGEASVECAVLEESHGVGGLNYHLVMAVCPTKNMDRYEWFVEKATELGVDEIVPVISEHSIRTSLKKERLEALALSATKQSLKSYLPQIAEPVSVLDFICRDYGKGELKLMAHCEEGEKETIRNCLAGFSGSVPEGEKPRVVIMIGPEGDFSAKEIQLAREKGFLPVTLGSSRLRVETAAVVAVSEIYFAFTCG